MESCTAWRRGLVAVEHDQLGGAEAVDLAAQLRADRAAGAGDEHPPAGEVVGDAGDVGVDLAAPEEVGGGERADVVERRCGRRTGRRPAGTASTFSPASSPSCASSRTRAPSADGMAMSRTSAPALSATRGDVGPGAPHLHAADAEVRLARVVVEDRDRQVGAVGVAEHGGDHLLGALAGAEHEHPRRALARSGACAAR